MPFVACEQTQESDSNDQAESGAAPEGHRPQDKHAALLKHLQPRRPSWGGRTFRWECETEQSCGDASDNLDFHPRTTKLNAESITPSRISSRDVALTLDIHFQQSAFHKMSSSWC